MEIAEQVAPAAESELEPDERDADLEPHDPDAEDEDGDQEPDDGAGGPQSDAEPDVEPDEAHVPPDPPAAATTAQTEREMEEKFKKLGKAADTWIAKVPALLGDDAQAFVRCELCLPDVPGFHLPPEMMEASSDEHARLIEVLRTPSSPEYVQSSAFRTCGECEGWGMVTTGSKVPGKERATCATCKGYGYVPPPGANVAAGAVPAGDNGQAHELPDGPLLEDADAWGSPRILADGRENPNYGKMPQYKDAGLP